MFKDVGKYLLFEKKLYKVFVFMARFGVFIAVAMILYLPYQGETNDIEENALNPELLSQSMSNQMSERTEKYLIDLKSTANIQDYVLGEMSARGQEVYKQDFTVRHENGTMLVGSNLIARFHTKRSHGYECNLFTYEYSRNPTKKKLRNVALILSFMRILKNPEINYLSRDILFVGFETEFKEYGRGINVFLEEYFHPRGISRIPRCGVIREAINLNLDDDFNTIALKLIGLNGRVPDRDFFLNINDLFIKSDIPYYYKDDGRDYFTALQNYMESKLRQVWQLLQLNSWYTLGESKIFRFSSFFGMLLESVQGNLHEAHSYLYKYGIHAVTIRGIHTQKAEKQALSQSYFTMIISRVLEGANRAYMALDEHLHAASTMYLPTQKKTSITIQKYCWPMAVVTASILIQTERQMILDLYLLKDHTLAKLLKTQVAMVWLKHILLDMAGFLTLTAPYIAQIINGNQFCTMRDSNTILDNLFSTYLFITLGIYLFVYFVFIRQTRKVIFGTNELVRSYTVMCSNNSIFNFQLIFGFIFTMILNLPTSIFGLLLTVLWLPFLQPLRPCFDKYTMMAFLRYFINIMFIVFYAYLAWCYLSIELIMPAWQTSVVNYMCVGTHFQMYLHVVGLTNLVRIVDILMF